MVRIKCWVVAYHHPRSSIRGLHSIKPLHEHDTVEFYFAEQRAWGVYGLKREELGVYYGYMGCVLVRVQVTVCLECETGFAVEEERVRYAGKPDSGSSNDGSNVWR